jgi:hypothetical protein
MGFQEDYTCMIKLSQMKLSSEFKPNKNVEYPGGYPV